MAADEQTEADELLVRHHTGALAKFVNSEANRKIYAEAAEKALGSPLTVIAVVGDRQKEPSQPGKAEAAPSGIIPQETGLDPAELKSNSNSALERARAMAEAYQKPAPTQPQPSANTSTPASTDKPEPRWKARAQKYRSEHQHNVDNGFNGVPLPPEPPEEEWDSAPPEAADPSLRAPVAEKPELASKKEQDDEFLDQIAEGPGEADHRKPLDIAGELVEKHLGGQRLR